MKVKDLDVKTTSSYKIGILGDAYKYANENRPIGKITGVKAKKLTFRSDLAMFIFGRLMVLH